MKRKYIALNSIAALNFILSGIFILENITFQIEMEF